MDLLTFLGQLGLGVAGNAIYDLISSYGQESVATDRVTKDIQNKINLHGITMKAETVINAMAENGFISIKRTELHAKDLIVFGSKHGGASVGNDSKLSTDKTAIEAKGNSSMNTEGNAQVRQNPDGSITFHVGEE